MKNAVETIRVNGIEFQIGYMNSGEYSGPVFEMKKGGHFYGVRCCDGKSEDRNEIGWNTGIKATEEELAAIAEARKIAIQKSYLNEYGY